MSRNKRPDPYDDEYDEALDEEANWAGGAGFDLGGEAHKWKSTRKLCCWPMYSESVTITAGELHIKRNECPALPRECRPYRLWAVTPLKNIRSFQMRKRLSKPLDVFVLFLVSLGLGLIGGGLISAYAVQPGQGLNGLEQASSAVGFNIDSSFFVFSVIVGISVCCVGVLLLTLRAPLRLVVSVDGAIEPESFSIDLIPGRVQPEEIKAKVDEFLGNGPAPQQQMGMQQNSMRMGGSQAYGGGPQYM